MLTIMYLMGLFLGFVCAAKAATHQYSDCNFMLWEMACGLGVCLLVDYILHREGRSREN